MILISATIATVVITLAYFDERKDRQRIENLINQTRPSDVLDELRSWEATPADVLREVRELRATVEQLQNQE